MTESEQAQTIANIKRAHRIAKLKLSSQGVEPLGIAAHLDRGALLEIVDSQAQKIAQLAEERDEARHRALVLREELYRCAVLLGVSCNHPLPWEKQ